MTSCKYAALSYSLIKTVTICYTCISSTHTRTQLQWFHYAYRFWLGATRTHTNNNFEAINTILVIFGYFLRFRANFYHLYLSEVYCEVVKREIGKLLKMARNRRKLQIITKIVFIGWKSLFVWMRVAPRLLIHAIWTISSHGDKRDIVSLLYTWTS